MTITATDEDFDVESQLEIFFDVPVLAQPEVTLPSAEIQVDSHEVTNTSVEIHNLGNGAQTYDIEMSSPAGWDVGLLELGPFQGSRQGSTGTLSKGGSITAGIMITPPGVLLTAGSTFYSQMLVKSRVSSETWSYQIPMVIQPSDSIELTPSSGGSEGGVPADSLHEITMQISNQGNREVVMSPIERELPGGWTIQGGLGEITVPMGSSVQWSFSIQGNGLAASGLVEIRFLIEDGEFFDWNTSLDAISGAVPEVSFHEVVFVEGTNINSSTSPLGLGAHPVNTAFDMGWKVENAGTSIWEPEVSLELPTDDWASSCTVNPIRISPGDSAMVWCSITIPLSQQAGSEPEVSLIMAADGVEVRETLTLLVDTVKEVEWALINFGEAREDTPTNLYLELHNTGNVAISNRIVTEGPDDWNIRIVDGILVTLQPGEGRSVQVEFTPDSGSDGSLKVMLSNAEDVSGQSMTLEIEVLSESSGGGSGTLLYAMGALVLVAIASISAGMAYSRNGGDISSLIRGKKSSPSIRKENTQSPQPVEQEPIDEEPVGGEEPATSEKQELQRFPDYPGWLWDPSGEEWVADPEFDHGDQ
tara:strand:- start:2325 stop:4088 length:1764 start_codon:yes stop_codon:yes gene_type:complete